MSDYIMNLRKYIGHDGLIGVGATTLVFNDKKELLLNLRTDTGTWGIPGGSMELYETIQEKNFISNTPTVISCVL